MPTESDTIKLARQLIREPSLTPDDCNCQEIIAEYIRPLGFEIRYMPFGPVKNIWAVRQGDEAGPMFVFAGHTDVVPTGPESQWHYPPFEGVIDGDLLHGRGAADMKGSLAAMLTATKSFLAENNKFSGSIGFLVTSDEEDIAIDGTAKVINALVAEGVKIDFCLVGEPSSNETIGDVIRVGRRGSLNGKLTIKGVQGHVAYPHEARNPIHEFAPCLTELTSMTWDEGDNVFPPTSFQISNIHAGTGASNVIPGELHVDFNFRFSPESSEASLKHRTEQVLTHHDVNYDIKWSLSGSPFITTGGELIPAVQQAIKKHTNTTTELSTSGGTSDGRFIAPHGIEVVELGPRNATIHKINEHISISDLEQLAMIYQNILQLILRPSL